MPGRGSRVVRGRNERTDHSMQHPALHRRTRRFTALLACLLAACASSTSRPDARELSVLSYNIKRGLGNDGITDIARAAEVIRRCAPDFVALQEIDVEDARSMGLGPAPGEGSPCTMAAPASAIAATHVT
mgnify:CR=1 FL=1